MALVTSLVILQDFFPTSPVIITQWSQLRTAVWDASSLFTKPSATSASLFSHPFLSPSGLMNVLVTFALWQILCNSGAECFFRVSNWFHMEKQGETLQCCVSSQQNEFHARTAFIFTVYHTRQGCCLECNANHMMT